MSIVCAANVLRS